MILLSPRARILDVSSLEPPEPFREALRALSDLGEDEYLVLLHRREPIPLYAALREKGFRWRTRKGERTAVEVVIWREGKDEPS